MDQATIADFEHADTVWQLGVEPIRIDVLTGIEGVEFEMLGLGGTMRRSMALTYR